VFSSQDHILLVAHHGEHELAQEKKPALQMCLRADSRVGEYRGKALTEHELRHLRCGLVPENAHGTCQRASPTPFWQKPTISGSLLAGRLSAANTVIERK
jgi:hypothetical protein